jgi:uncharacterized protein (TIGR02996 family)
MNLADLLATVVNNPREDAPRLAYADAIEPTDPARANLIRSQIALARPRVLDRLERQRLVKKIARLTKEHGTRWVAELPSLPGVSWPEAFDRGFVAFCTVTDGKTFRRQAGAIFPVAPIEGLSVSKGLDDAEAARFAECPFLAQLRTLGCWNGSLTDAGACALAASPHWHRLRTLDLTQNKIGSDGLRALAHSTTLPSLTGLHVYGNKIDDSGIIDLATSPLAARLRRLNVGGSSATVAAARALAESPTLARLVSLDIDNSSIGDAGLMYLAHSPHLARLREIYLRHTGIGDAGVAVLLRSPLAPHLRILDIEAADITGITAWQIVRSPSLGKLRKLEMADCDNLEAPVTNALKRRFGKRVEVHVDDRLRRPKPNPEAATRDVFLADIRATPDDDAPRLIYADWLHDHGEPERGEFIRVQCQLARLPATDPRRPTMELREHQLLLANQERWTEQAFLAWLEHPLAECPDPYTHRVCKVMARAVAARLAPDEPTSEETLDKCSAALEKLKMCGHQARQTLFDGCLFQRGFLDTVFVPELMLLEFTGAVRDLGVVRHLTAQHDGDVDAEVGDRVVQRVIACFDVPRLRTLRIDSHVEELATVEMIAAWPGTAELTHLELGFLWDVPGDDALRVLSRSPYLRNLESLRLYLCDGCTLAGVQALADSPHLPALKVVYLGEDENDVPADAVRLLRERFPVARES